MALYQIYETGFPRLRRFAPTLVGETSDLTVAINLYNKHCMLGTSGTEHEPALASLILMKDGVPIYASECSEANGIEYDPDDETE